LMRNEQGLGGRCAHAAVSLRHECSPYRRLHVRRESVGCVPRSRASLRRPVPNPFSSESQHNSTHQMKPSGGARTPDRASSVRTVGVGGECDEDAVSTAGGGGGAARQNTALRAAGRRDRVAAAGREHAAGGAAGGTLVSHTPSLTRSLALSHTQHTPGAGREAGRGGGAPGRRARAPGVARRQRRHGQRPWRQWSASAGAASRAPSRGGRCVLAPPTQRCACGVAPRVLCRSLGGTGSGRGGSGPQWAGQRRVHRAAEAGASSLCACGVVPRVLCRHSLSSTLTTSAC
jgi:hypothetical protein